MGEVGFYCHDCDHWTFYDTGVTEALCELCSEAILVDEEITLNVGDIVQLDPEKTKNPMFRACLMVVTDLYSWGVQGYVQSLGENGAMGGQAYYRAEWGTFDTTGGAAVWLVSNK